MTIRAAETEANASEAVQSILRLEDAHAIAYIREADRAGVEGAIRALSAARRSKPPGTYDAGVPLVEHLYAGENLCFEIGELVPAL